MGEIRKILAELKPDVDFDSLSDFVMDGALDSFDILNLVRSLENRFLVRIDGAAIVPENFASCESIARLVEQSTPAEVQLV